MNFLYWTKLIWSPMLYSQIISLNVIWNQKEILDKFKIEVGRGRHQDPKYLMTP